MLNPPKTKEEAEKIRYRTWAGNPHGTKYLQLACAYAVPDGDRSPLSHQCHRAPGHGPDGLYCKQHAKMVEAALAAKE